MLCKRVFAAAAVLSIIGQVAACSGDGGRPGDGPVESSETCELRTDLTRGTLDGTACDMAYDVVGISNQANFHMCTEYLYETTLVDEEGTCDRTDILGYCVSVDDRDASLVKVVYVYADQDSVLNRCDQLKLKSGQCLNRATDTWCNVPE